MVDTNSPMTFIVLGKRKRQTNLVLQLSGGSSCDSDTDAVSEFSLSDGPVASSSKLKLNTAPIIVNGKLVTGDKRRYQCTFDNCKKSYKKPSRLEEHERTHTGERPFVCLTCQKTYFRESHLQAHARSHLPDTARPFACTRENCEKRFWTIQHLKRHEELHSGDKPFKCSELGCDQSFSKHSQLRFHFSSSHCPPGTLPFRCEHRGCLKSFPTNQKLKAHAKTHEDRRYTCSHPKCFTDVKQEYFMSWTALQAHTRTTHPATCPYESCGGKTFTQQKGLRAHLKLHEQHEVEEALSGPYFEDCDGADDEDENRPKKKRRGGEIGRDWKCSEEDCDKDFKSKKALATHLKIVHMNRRDFVCSTPDCGATFGYKHLLQRHVARVHSTSINLGESFQPEATTGVQVATATPSKKTSRSVDPDSIDFITGKAYNDNAKERLAAKAALACPYPGMAVSLSTDGRQPHTNLPSSICTFVFSRAYDLRRHLSTAHSMDVDREETSRLVTALQQGREATTNSV